jgi:hypothetical protein
MKGIKKPLRAAIGASLVAFAVKVIEITPRRYLDVFGYGWVRRRG